MPIRCLHRPSNRAKPRQFRCGTQSNFKADDFQEKDLARIIVAFGKEMFDEEEQLSVAEFIISNIEEVLDDFDNPEYAAIVKAAHRFLADEEKAPDDMFFIHHPDPAISKLSIDLLAEPYEYSENWEKKWEILLRMQPMPSLNFTEDSVQALKRFKLRKIEKVIQQNLDAIKEHGQSGDEDKLQIRLNVHQKLLGDAQRHRRRTGYRHHSITSLYMPQKKQSGKQSGLVYSTDPDFVFNLDDDEEPTTLEPARQNLRVQIDRKQRGGKEVTLVTGFVGSQDELDKLGKMLKTKCGVGGAAKNGEIMVQGNHRDRVVQLLLDAGYKQTKKSGG
jgi:translation initiation factor 1